MNKAVFIISMLVLTIIGFSGCKSFLKSKGLHPDFEGETYDLNGKKALIVTTSHGILNKPGETTGEPTGVFASEMTIPYYEFLAAKMEVHVASIKGDEIPIDPQSFKYLIRTESDEKYLEDDIFQAKVKSSTSIVKIDFTDYDVIFCKMKPSPDTECCQVRTPSVVFSGHRM